MVFLWRASAGIWQLSAGSFRGRSTTTEWWSFRWSRAYNDCGRRSCPMWISWLQTFLQRSHTTATLVCCTSLKTCLTKTSTLEHQSEFTLFGVVQKLSGCWTICTVGEADVSNLLEVCCRWVRGRHERAIWLSASRSKAGSRRTMPSQNFFFLGSCSICMFASKGIDTLDRQRMTIYMNNNIHYGERLRCKPFRAFQCYLWQLCLYW